MPRGAPRRGPAAAETAAVRTVPTPPSGADPPHTPPGPESRPRPRFAAPSRTHHARVAVHQHLCGPAASPGRAGPRGRPRLRPSFTPPERRLPSPARSSAPAPTPCTPVIAAGARPPRRGRASARGAGDAPPAPEGPRRLPTGGGGEGRPGLLQSRRAAPGTRLPCPPLLRVTPFLGPPHRPPGLSPTSPANPLGERPRH